MRLFPLFFLTVSISSFSNTWSFESKSPQEMNSCEVIASKYSMWLTHKISTGTSEFEILDNFRGILSDIEQAGKEGKLTPVVLQSSSDVNLTLMMYRRYGQIKENQEILEGLTSIEAQFPELLMDVCSGHVESDL
jgi:hypothetical protein